MDQTLRLKKELNCKVSSTTRTGKVYRKKERESKNYDRK